MSIEMDTSASMSISEFPKCLDTARFIKGVALSEITFTYYIEQQKSNNGLKKEKLSLKIPPIDQKTQAQVSEFLIGMI